MTHPKSDKTPQELSADESMVAMDDYMKGEDRRFFWTLFAVSFFGALLLIGFFIKKI
jgi:hypothetical protein